MKYLLLICLAILISCDSKIQEKTNQKEAVVIQSDSSYYQEKHRQQFHFSPERNWMNDPNGMVFYNNEYHLFYQYYPESTVWGPMHWGHAVSKDMISWEHLPIAIYPDDNGYIFSGSAVVDWNNSSGFGTSESPPLVAVFTYHKEEKAENQNQVTQTQGLAYSNDSGRTWEVFGENPVLMKEGEPDFRDPKVIWHEPTNKWVMALAVKDHIEFYGSTNLKEWNFLSEFGKEEGMHGAVWECPDLFPLPVENSDKSNWVLIVSIGTGGDRGSATQYFVGDFDGTKFKNSHYPERHIWIDHGWDNYAGVTWSDIPKNDGRRIFLGWMSNWLYAQVVPTETWRNAMTIPRSMVLFETVEGLRVRSYPVEESKLLRKKSSVLNRTLINIETDWSRFLDKGNHRLDMELMVTKVVNSSSWEIELSNELDEVFSFGFEFESNRYFTDRTSSGDTSFHAEFAKRHWAPRLSKEDAMPLRVLIDNSSIEFFGDVGEVVMTDIFFPSEPYSKMKFKAPEEVLVTAEIYHLKSIWE